MTRRRRSIEGVWWRIFETMSDEPDVEYLIVESIKPSSTLPELKRGSEDQAIGRPRGGLSTRIHIAVRGLGFPVPFTLTAGQESDALQAAPLIKAWQPRSSWAIQSMMRTTYAEPSPPRQRWLSFPTTHHGRSYIRSINISTPGDILWTAASASSSSSDAYQPASKKEPLETIARRSRSHRAQ